MRQLASTQAPIAAVCDRAQVESSLQFATLCPSAVATLSITLRHGPFGKLQKTFEPQ